MKGKNILIMIATAVVCIVVTKIANIQKAESKKSFQEALERYENSPKFQNDSAAQQKMIEDVQNIEEKHEQSVYPTKGEIDSANAELPILVSEGTLNTKIEYNEDTKVQTFYYRFTQEVDKNLVTPEVLTQLKSNMVEALKKSPNNIRRLNAGMTFLYVYYSVDGRKLYNIKIDSKDINQYL